MSSHKPQRGQTKPSHVDSKQNLITSERFTGEIKSATNGMSKYFVSEPGKIAFVITTRKPLPELEKRFKGAIIKPQMH